MVKTTQLLSLFFALIFSISTVFAQDIPMLQAQYPQDNVVMLNKIDKYVINIVADTIQVVKYVEEQTLYLTSNDLRYSKDYIFYNSFSKIDGIKAYTSIPNKKGKYDDIPVVDFEYQDVVSGGVFYDDRKKIQFVYPMAQAGAITTLRYTETYTDPRMLDIFFFNSYMPVLNATVSVEFPAEVEMAWKLLGVDTSGINFSKKTDNGRLTYTWTAKELPKFEYEADAPDRSYFDPHIIIRIASATINGNKQNILSNTDDLYSWYTEFIQEVNVDGAVDLKSLVLDIVKGAKTDAEKAQKLFEWVQTNITYVAFEDGMGGFVPRDAVAVCNKKYGDCKDMANLLKNMLRLADLNSSLAWIGTRSRPYNYKDVPTPIVDNHMITALWLDDEVMFLDATGSYTPFGLPSSMIQGKEALIEQGPNKYIVVQVPIVSSKLNNWTDSTTLTINDTELVGVGTSYWSGYRKVSIEYDYYGADRLDERIFMTDLLKRGSNKFKLGKFSMTGMTQPNSNLKVAYDFTVPGYVKAFSGKIFVNLNIDKHLSTQSLDLDKRKYGREFEFTFEENNYVALVIPDGYEVNYLPEPISYDNASFGFTISYKVLNGKVVYEKVMRLNTLIVQPEDFENWNAFIDQLNKAYKETVVLTQKENK